MGRRNSVRSLVVIWSGTTNGDLRRKGYHGVRYAVWKGMVFVVWYERCPAGI